MSASDQTSTPCRLTEIWQYPFKGFPGQRFHRVKVIADQLLPADRRFAVSNGHPVSHKKLNEGFDEKEIYDLLKDKYGDWILYEPQFNKNTYFLWLLPVLMFLVGGAIILKLFIIKKN